MLRHFEGEGLSVAFLYTRPGRRGLSATDRAWVTMLAAAAQRPGMRGWPVHRANDHELVVCSPDDVAA